MTATPEGAALPPRHPAPDVPGLARPRLLRQLDGARVALVVGAQGSGKSTLLAQAAALSGRDVAWVRYGPDGRGVLRATTTPPPRPVREVAGLGHVTDPAQVARLAREPLLLVVDDAHHAIGTPDEAALASLLADAPPQVSVLVAARRPLPRNLARYELAPPVVLTDPALRFRSWEVERLYREEYGIALEHEDVAALTWHTDGWAAALHLFHLAVADDLPGECRRAIRRLAHRQRFAWEYLTTQVLATLPVEIQRFLHTTSPLELLTPARCDALCGTDDSAELLRDAARATSLLRPVGDGYRLHRVLRRHLLTALADEMSVEQARAVHAHAADVLEREGARTEALRARARAHDVEGVRRLLPFMTVGALDGGERDFGPTFGPDLVDADGGVLLAHVRELVADGRVATAIRVLDGATGRTDVDPVDLAVVRHAIVGLHGDDPAEPPVPVDVGGPLTWSQVVVSAALGQPASAVPHARTLRQGGALAEGVARLLGGDQRAGRELLREAAGDVDADATMMLLAQLLAATLAGERPPDGLAPHLDRLHAEAERRGSIWLARIMHGVVAAFDGDAAPAEVDRVVAACERDQDLWSALLVTGARVVARARSGHATPADWETLALRCRSRGAGTLEAWARAWLAVAAVEAGLPDAGTLAAQAESLARTAAVPGALAVAYVALAGCTPHARGELLRLASSTAREAGMATDPGAGRWAPEAPEAPRVGDGPRPAEPAHSPGGEHEDTVGQHSVEETRPTLVHLREGSSVLTVRCFGRFEVAVEGRVVDQGRLRPMARRTLRFLAVHAGRAVHREQLAAALWGERDPGGALHGLHVNVSAVRRALVPDGAPRSEGLLRRDGESYLLRLPPGSDCDVSRFDQRVSRARRLEREDPTGAVDAWQLALDAYGGELLPEEGTAEWILPLRERYVVQAAAAAGGLAVAAARVGDPGRAAHAARRSVELDPWADAPWRVLVSSLTDLGDHAAAARAAREYAAVLRELGVADSTGPTDPGTPPPRRPPTSRASPGRSTRS
ncbi:BTAD domain-containing putative transcriptional regulator [Cellulosimicrobium protaetiae]|uniref:OmpR/PhoB-type domain-containing protein n=1 Tax=Cellulosimicrobium protaetiae TaxID=2587808 RepID=A0A6M5U8M5_9MICO|nr:BTAD domain-containing putative transcriptional regulator [Cellulosimicrobium protaetiae]QJW34866.1 hypothetical protein FIC82_000275 [Cellulosimicrobium protaetiae]